MANKSIKLEQVPTLQDLQFNARAIALELKVLGTSYDTLGNLTEFGEMVEGWEIPQGRLPAKDPLMLYSGGILMSEGPRIIGREVRFIEAQDVATQGMVKAIQQGMFNLEAKHDIHEKIKAHAQSQPA